MSAIKGKVMIRKIICWMLIVCFMTACSTTRKTVTKSDGPTSYSCLEPELVLENGIIKGQFFENMSGREVDVEEKCVTHHTWYGQDIEKHGFAKATFIYVFWGVLTLGIIPGLDLLTVWGNGKTYCEQRGQGTVRHIEDKYPAEGRFTGSMTVVQLDKPDWQHEKVFNRERLGNVDVAVNDAYAKYAVELWGDYESDKVECRLAKQAIVTP